jgi:amidophosphoribosyltransferase
MDTDIEMEFDSSCFDGKYVTGNITEDYLKKLYDKRNDSAKQEDSDEDQVLDLHNDSA